MVIRAFQSRFRFYQVAGQIEKVFNSGHFFFSRTCCTAQTFPVQRCIVITTGILNLGISALEDYIVQHLNRYISSLLLAAALAAPVVMIASPRPQEASVQLRVYDRDHRDYHNWDDRENHAYRQYLGEQHRSYHEYQGQNRKVQRHYWNWRHSHPDNY
jgi:hypothetical protein